MSYKLRIILEYFQPKIGRRIRIFSLDRKNNILIKKKSVVEFYKIVFGMNKLNLTIFFNLPSVIQPALTIHISYVLSQQSVVHRNILFLSESSGTGIVYQDLLLRMGA